MLHQETFGVWPFPFIKCATWMESHFFSTKCGQFCPLYNPQMPLLTWQRGTVQQAEHFSSLDSPSPAKVYIFSPSVCTSVYQRYKHFLLGELKQFWLLLPCGIFLLAIKKNTSCGLHHVGSDFSSEVGSAAFSVCFHQCWAMKCWWGWSFSDFLTFQKINDWRSLQFSVVPEFMGRLGHHVGLCEFSFICFCICNTWSVHFGQRGLTWGDEVSLWPETEWNWLPAFSSTIVTLLFWGFFSSHTRLGNAVCLKRYFMLHMEFYCSVKIRTW